MLPFSKLVYKCTAEDLDEDDEGVVDAINGAFMLTRREALDVVGLLDERFWMYGEDLDWCFRFQAAGLPIYYWPGVTVVHAKGGSSGRARSWNTNLAFHSCMWLFYRKHQYRRASPVVNALVWLAIWAKFVLSATVSTGRRYVWWKYPTR